MLGQLACIGLGGALGSIARHLLGGVVQERLGAGFPYGTLVVNVLGSCALAFVMAVATKSDAIGPNLRLALTTGVMGGFTTYSTYSYETMRLLQAGSFAVAGLYVVVTVLGCLVAAYGGHALGRLVVGT
jgi:CrcB protein